MTTRKSKRIHVVLELDALDEAAQDALVASILKMAPGSPLYAQIPLLQEEVANLAKVFAALKAAQETAAVSAAQHTSDVTAASMARAVCDNSLRLLATLIQTHATSAADVQSMAFVPRKGRPPPPALVPPEAIDVRMGPRGSGRATVSGQYTGKTRRNFAVETSGDPFTPASWGVARGFGKSRKLAGESGTRVWVRFALVFGQQRSEWGTPVLITLP